jgi:hypothetical protein
MNQLISDGLKSEEIVINYTDTLITAMNPRRTDVENVVPDPHPSSIDMNAPKEDRNNDFEALINCVQRHVCRPEGYCKSKKKEGCGFGYRMHLEEKNRIEFTQYLGFENQFLFRFQYSIYNVYKENLKHSQRVFY